jgi:hypothetical protein
MEEKGTEQTVTDAAMTVQPKKGNTSLKRVLVGVVVLVLVVGAGLGGYFYGVSVGKSSFPGNMQFTRGQFNQQGGPGQRDPNQTAQPRTGLITSQGGGVFGSISKIDGATLTVKTAGGDVQVLTTDTTLIEKYASVTVADLAVGEQVTVQGSTNDDGSVTARSVQTIRGFQASATAQP